PADICPIHKACRLTYQKSTRLGLISLYYSYPVSKQPTFFGIVFDSRLISRPRNQKIVRDRNQPDDAIFGLVPLLDFELIGILKYRETISEMKSKTMGLPPSFTVTFVNPNHSSP